MKVSGRGLAAHLAVVAERHRGAHDGQREAVATAVASLLSAAEQTPEVYDADRETAGDQSD